MRPNDFLPALDKLHSDFRIPYFADNIVYLTSDSETKRLDTDIFFSIFADHPKRARAWWAVSVETTDEPFTREYSVETSARTTSTRALPSGIQGFAVHPGVHPPDHARPVQNRRTA